MIQRKVEAGFLDAVAAYFHHSTPGLGPHIETYQNREWGEKNREWALSTLRWMERLLGDRDFLVGERLTSADITLLQRAHQPVEKGLPVGAAE